MAKFRVAHTYAGEFKQNTIISDAQIKDAGADIEFWKKAGAIVPVTVVEGEEPTNAETPSGQPAEGDGTAQGGAVTGTDEPVKIPKGSISAQDAKDRNLVLDSTKQFYVSQ